MYEFTYVAGVSMDVDEKMRQHEITEFNAQFLGYAKGRITVQEFAGLYNLAKDWSERNPSDVVTINVSAKSGSGVNSSTLRNFINNPNKSMEDFLTDFLNNNTEAYYFEFNVSDVSYNSDGRVSELRLSLGKK